MAGNPTSSDSSFEASLALSTASHERFNRFSLLDKPKPAAFCKPAKPIPDTQGKAHRGRNVGKLTLLVNLPLDVFFEIASHLHPLDVLHLARVSKHFRSVFMSRQSRSIWLAALRGVRGLPECPRDLNEAEYTALVFERSCKACGNSRGNKVEYGLRLRLCTPCVTENIVKGYAILKMQPYLPRVIYTLLPAALHPLIGSGLSRSLYWPVARQDSQQNSQDDAYYRAEVEMIVDKYISLSDDAPALLEFVQERQAIASEMMRHGYTIYRWDMSCKEEKRQHDTEVLENRRRSIEQKMSDLGWEKQFYPNWFDSADQREWRKLIRQPKDLTARRWALIQPKLEEIYMRIKQKRLGEKSKVRRSLSCHGLGPNMEGCWSSILESVVIGSEGGEEEMKTHWLLSLQDSMPTQFQVGTADDILGRASSVFFCSCRRCEQRWGNTPVGEGIFGFPAILEHMQEGPKGVCWHPSRQKCYKDASQVALLLLGALGLPYNIARQDVDASLEGRLMCLCGHPRYRGAMGFDDLIRHILIQTRWYRNATEEAAPGAVVNHHELRWPNTCVAIIPSDADVDATDDFFALY